MTKYTNRHNMIVDLPSTWEETDDGFLRVKARVLMETVMPYCRDELEEIPPECIDDPVLLYVSRASMANADSLRSLEGASVVAGWHNWLDPEVIKQHQVGHVAGSPHMDGPYLVCDLMITDPDAIEKIKNKELVEISAAYLAEALYGAGEFDGHPYHAEQRQLRYNHIAVIPAGSGRAGRDVRILNKTKQSVTNGGEAMAEDIKTKFRLRLKNTGRTIVVENEETVKAVEEEMDNMEQGSMESGKKLEETMSDLETKNGELAALQEEVAELKGELSTYKDKLEELLSEGAVESAAEGMAEEIVEERGEAEEILENAVVMNDAGEESEEEKEKVMNSLKTLRGSALHKTVLASVGVKCENMSPPELKGAFKAHHQISVSTKGRKSVAGVRMNNSFIPDAIKGTTVGVQRTAHQRLGYKKVE